MSLSADKVNVAIVKQSATQQYPRFRTIPVIRGCTRPSSFVGDYDEGKKFAGSVHPEATLLGLITHWNTPHPINYDAEIDDVEELAMMLQERDRFIAVGSSNQCCFCCHIVGRHKGEDVIDAYPGTNGVIHPWTPPCVGVKLSILKDVEAFLWDQCDIGAKDIRPLRNATPLYPFYSDSIISLRRLQVQRTIAARYPPTSRGDSKKIDHKTASSAKCSTPRPVHRFAIWTASPKATRVLPPTNPNRLLTSGGACYGVGVGLQEKELSDFPVSQVRGSARTRLLSLMIPTQGQTKGARALIHSRVAAQFVEEVECRVLPFEP
ncbi:hypothetical protein CC2G_002034 [Coprinopsis cinerea AmutBmut pab1-1]|nr:hypothetical protein CC2G_002034 [Coprinopsis cinerea AmutBmut pab1-1]